MDVCFMIHVQYLLGDLIMYCFFINNNIDNLLHSKLSLGGIQVW